MNYEVELAGDAIEENTHIPGKESGKPEDFKD